MITLIALVTLAGGYLAGRLHGKAAHHRFLAEGFRYLDNLTKSRIPQTYTVQGPLVSANDVSRAFGSLRDER